MGERLSKKGLHLIFFYSLQIIFGILDEICQKTVKTCETG